MKRKLIAMMSALAMCLPVMPYNVSAMDVPEKMPEWIPQNFTEALHFDNQYGRIHIEDDLICCVWQIYDDKCQYTTGISGITEVFSDTLVFEMPPEPDKSDEQAYQEYLDFIRENNLTDYVNYFKHYGEEVNIKSPFKYEVAVYKMNPSGSADIQRISKDGDRIVSDTTFSFESSADGEITETDIYGWFPDCISECNFDTVSVVNGHIVFCDDVCYDGGFSLMFEQTGTAELEYVAGGSFYLESIAPSAPGTSPVVVKAYKPLNAGQVKVTFRQAQDWEGGYVGETVVKYYNVDDNGNITEADCNITDGDCNGDGQFTISDVVMFQKWLSGTGELTNWKNADLTFDNKLDVFDLVLMKKAVIENMPTIDYDYKEVSKDDITILKQEILSRYPDTDMKDFTFVYNPDHPQTYSKRKAFDIYYKGVKLKGDERYNICASVYTRPDGLREVDMNLLKTPEEIMEVDTSVKCIDRYEMKKLLDSEEYPELTIYVNHWDKPVLAYRLEDENGFGATIYDAVTGEEIEYIPYLVCVLPTDDLQ